MEELYKALREFGFPVALSIYLLFRFEKLLREVLDIVKGKDGILDKIEEILEKCKQ